MSDQMFPHSDRRRAAGVGESPDVDGIVT